MNTTVLFLLAGAALLVGLFFAFKPQTNQVNQPTTIQEEVEDPTKKTFELVVQAKKLVSGPEKLTATEGDTVTIKITSDEEEEFHLHSYDKSVDLEINQTVEITFVADKTGSFPYELEESKTEIGVLEVYPK